MNFKVVIPARLGSKRFPGKNKAKLNGVPLIHYSINYAINSGIPLDDIWVNTDDQDILDIADEFHVKSYKRPSHLGNDLTSTAAVLQDQLVYMKSHHIEADAFILLQVTNPLRPENLLDEAIRKFSQVNRSSLATFSKLNKKFGTIKSGRFKPKNYKPGQRMQDLESLYYENGLIYISSRELILNGEVIGSDVYPMIVDHPFSLIDIDEPEDMVLAEAYMKIYNKNAV